MTIEEIIEGLKFTVAMCEYDPSTGETIQRCFMNDMTGITYDACKAAIEALKSQPCEDCISRAYIEPIVEELENICINGDEYILSLLSSIKNAPQVKLQRPKGKWIVEREEIITEDSFISYPHTKCSLCKVEVRFATSFCPNCGAEMRGESDDT